MVLSRDGEIEEQGNDRLSFSLFACSGIDDASRIVQRCAVSVGSGII